MQRTDTASRRSSACGTRQAPKLVRCQPGRHGVLSHAAPPRRAPAASMTPHCWRCPWLRRLGFWVHWGRRPWISRPGLPLAVRPQEATAEEIEACPAKHLAFHHFEAINMPFDRASTPGQRDAGFYGLILLLQAGREALKGLQRTGHGAREPGIKALRLPLADQASKVLREVHGFGNLGMVRVEFGELLGLGL